MRRGRAWLLLGLAVAGRPLAAQAPPDSAAADTTAPRPVRWYGAAAVAAGVTALIFVADEPVRQWAQEVRTPVTDDVARLLTHFGQPEVVLTVPAGMALVALLTGNDALLRSSGRVAGSFVVSFAATRVLKFGVGRARPFKEEGARSFHPFSEPDAALPSGHATAAFSLAASLSNEIGRWWATLPLYTLATGTAWARINDDKHWLGDVTLGAAVGITTAQVMTGRWTVFGLGTPQFLVAPDEVAVSMTVPFRLR